MKKSIFSLLAIFSTVTLSAKSFCPPVEYELYGQCLYLQPNGSHLNYGVEAIGLDSSISVPIVSPNWNTFEIDPDYHFGFELGAKAIFPNMEQLDLNWERFRGNDSDTFVASPDPGFMVGPYFDIGPNSSSYKIAHGKASFHFDKVDLLFGKDICLCNDFLINLHGGVSYASIKQTLSSFFSNNEGTITRSIQSPSKYEGIGPELGLDYSYALFDCLSFVGTSNASLLMGRLKNSTTFLSTTPELAALGVEQPNTQSTSVPHRSQLVPGFEQKLGLSYVALLCNCKVFLELGYQCQIYVNAIQTVDMTAPQVLPAGALFTPQVGVFAVGFERNLSNFILSGPYASLNVRF